MAASTHPKFSISYKWALGEHDWNVGMDDNLRDLALFTQLVVNAVTDAAPASPTNGETHIVGATPSGAFGGHTNEVAIYLDAAWVFYTPIQGYTATNKADNNIYIFNGSAWVVYAPIGAGDMLLSVYDTNASGKVDVAEKVNGVDTAQNNQYYGKNNAGGIGFHDLPSGIIPDGTADGEVPVWDNTNKVYTPTNITTKDLSISVSAMGVLNDGEILAIYSSVTAYNLPQNLVGSTSYARTPATAPLSIAIEKNGTPIGSVDFAIGANVGTYTFSATTSFTISDRVAFVVPATSDLTLADVSITLLANL